MKDKLVYLFVAILSVAIYFLSTGVKGIGSELAEFKRESAKIRTEILVRDSLFSTREQAYRVSLDSVSTVYNLRLDSLEKEIRIVNYKEFKIEKEIKHINSIIGDLPDL